MRLAVAVEFPSGAAGAFRLATSTPLMYATKPSLYFVRNTSEVNDSGTLTPNGSRSSTVELTPCMSAPMSTWTASATPEPARSKPTPVPTSSINGTLNDSLV